MYYVRVPRGGRAGLGAFIEAGDCANDLLGVGFCSWIDAVGQTFGITALPSLPTPPALQPPPAPKTAAAMVNWTPEIADEVTAQVSAQYQADYSGSTPAVVASTDPGSSDGSSWGWYAVAAGGALLLALVLKR